MPASLDDMASVNLEPPGGDQDFFSDNDNGYASSFHAADGFSPVDSPSISPRVPTGRVLLEGVEEESAHQLSFADTTMFPPSQSNQDFDDLLSPNRSAYSPRAVSIADLDLNATVEDTGISAEEVQAYISEQDPETHRWTCLFPECDKTFGRRENIRSHVQTHLGDRQYRCSHCGKCFVRQHDLKRHSKIHTGDKPYKCPCGGGFARQDALTRHRQRGVCVGGFPNAVRSSARRGRPKKKRPDLEERIEKAQRSREKAAATVAHYASSYSGGSHCSDPRTPPPPDNDFGGFDTAQFTELTNGSDPSDPFRYVPIVSRSDTREASNSDGSTNTPRSFNNSSSPFDSPCPTSRNTTHAHQHQLQRTFHVPSSPTPYHVPTESASDTIFRLAENIANTPPESPTAKSISSSADSHQHQGDYTLSSSDPAAPKSPNSHQNQDSKSDMSAAFTTPPTSPLCEPSSVLFDEYHSSMTATMTMGGEYDLSSVTAGEMSMFCDENGLFGGNGMTMAGAEYGAEWI